MKPKRRVLKTGQRPGMGEGGGSRTKGHLYEWPSKESNKGPGEEQGGVKGGRGVGVMK